MRYIILSTWLVAITASTTIAQVGFAPEIGVNRSYLGIKSYGTDIPTGVKNGLAVGGIVHCVLSNSFFLESGLFYLMNGCTVTGGGAININTMQVPLNIDYVSKNVHEHGIRGFGGISPYIAYNFSGTSTTDGKSDALKIGSAKKDASGNGDDIKAINYGIGINLGSFLPDGLYVRVRYQISLSDLSPGADAHNSIFGYSASASIGYVFGYKRKMANGENSRKYWYNDHRTRYYNPGKNKNGWQF